MSVLRTVLVVTTAIQVQAFVAMSHNAQPTHRRLQRMRLAQPERKKGLLGAWEDVLDYLTNMGGYTGFTEEELKGGQASTEWQMIEKLEKKDMSSTVI